MEEAIPFTISLKYDHMVFNREKDVKKLGVKLRKMKNDYFNENIIEYTLYRLPMTRMVFQS